MATKKSTKKSSTSADKSTVTVENQTKSLIESLKKVKNAVIDVLVKSADYISDVFLNELSKTDIKDEFDTVFGDKSISLSTSFECHNELFCKAAHIFNKIDEESSTKSKNDILIYADSYKDIDDNSAETDNSNSVFYNTFVRKISEKLSKYHMNSIRLTRSIGISNYFDRITVGVVFNPDYIK